MNRLSMSVAERVARYTDTGAGPDACHPYAGPLSRGKPVISTVRSSLSARRVAWEQVYGALPGNRVFMTCNSRTCMNVKHMISHDEIGRFWKWVDKSGGPDACWPWTGSKVKGYGQFQRADQSKAKCTRFAWELTNGPIVGHVKGDEENEICVCHRCDNPPCCNPAHMFLGKDADNHADMVAKGRHPIIAAAKARKALVSGCAGLSGSEANRG